MHELNPGAGLFIKQDGSFKISQIHKSENPAPCSFERIYFSRGSDRDIYRERKTLGRLLTPQILESIDQDVDHTVLSFIPNTAEVAYYGMMEGFEAYLNQKKTAAILNKKKALSETEVEKILQKKIRTEKLTIKDIKLRTFITEDKNRNDLAAHVYDITYGTIKENEDNIVVIDDSIVRGTTLKQSIIKILSRLKPKKIVIVSSSPQIRYPDCYGIDMSRMNAVDQLSTVYKIETGQQSGDEMSEQIRQQVWDNKVTEILLGKQTEKLGMAVSKDELKDLTIGNHISPIIYSRRAFIDPKTGQFSKEALLGFLASLDQASKSKDKQHGRRMDADR